MKLRVRFAETDQMGIAHHGAYVIWMEAARVEWLRDIGMNYKDLEAGGVSLAVSGLQISYRHSAAFDDLVIVKTSLAEAKSRKIVFNYDIFLTETGTLLATGWSRHTPTDRAGRAVRLPEDWLLSLRAQLG